MGRLSFLYGRNYGSRRINKDALLRMRIRAKGVYCLTAIALSAGGVHDACRIAAHTIYER